MNYTDLHLVSLPLEWQRACGRRPPWVDDPIVLSCTPWNSLRTRAKDNHRYIFSSTVLTSWTGWSSCLESDLQRDYSFLNSYFYTETWICWNKNLAIDLHTDLKIILLENNYVRISNMISNSARYFKILAISLTFT